MARLVERILGDTPVSVIFKLAVISFFVGAFMLVLGLTPIDVVFKIISLIERLWSMGFTAFHELLRVLAFGAAVVIPIFVILRLFTYRR